MANYGVGVYGASKYGVTPRLAYSVAPMSILVVNFSEAYVYWQVPSGTFTKVRLVRNQNSYPEHAEDGYIVWQETNTTVSRTFFLDGEDPSTAAGIIPGKPIYYKMFLFTGDKIWVDAGSVTGLIPSDHGMQKVCI